MAAKKTHIQNSQNTRNRIKAGMIIKKLTDHILNCDQEVILMSPSQVRAAEILLKKVLPDLSNVDMAALVDVNKRPTLVDLSGGKLKSEMDKRYKEHQEDRNQLDTDWSEDDE